ncbi:Agamous-like MADS-box protein [Melia azedarach]|uniref:Agamous-like MADS-box protein n=1 Tax=Melia azedarach TaxID=155640 RepID=A0ACC1YN08_MELAZ|nr:Agamous-like MADS-box protein [Melia azedarach]
MTFDFAKESFFITRVSFISKEKQKPCSSGRRKIEIKRIENTFRRKVAFMKRRKGLFSKAGEVSRLFDANIAIIVFSAAGKMFSFGHPSTDHVIDYFLSEEDEEDDDNNSNNPCKQETMEEESLERQKKKGFGGKNRWRV